MKLLKTYITIAVINVIGVAGVVNYGSVLRNFVSPGVPGQAGVMITPIVGVVPSPVVTPKPPKKRVIRVTRTPSSSGAGVADSPTSQVSEPQPGGGSSALPAAANPTSAPAPVQDNRCLIGIDGAQYDVSAYRSMHPGGDIFQCGADMSRVFWAQHGANTLNKMAKYRQ